MNAPTFDTCTICGQPARRAGESLCVRHDFQALITSGYQRMMERLKRPSRPRVIGTSKPKITKGNL